MLRKLISQAKSSFLFRWISVLCAVSLSDFIWAHYIVSMANSTPLEAALWAVGVIVLGAYIVVSYVDDRRLILPAAIGAFIGTYYGV